MSDLAARHVRDRALDHDVSTDVRPAVSASWRRVRAGGLAPGAEPEVPPLVETEVEQRRTTSPLAPWLPRIRESLEPVAAEGQLVVVTDAEGRVLWQDGRPGVRRLADRLGFVRGSSWTEANVGTNAIGTSLVDGAPVHLRGAEHYVESHTRWSCAAAPVRDPRTGVVLGVVDVSGPAGSVPVSVLALVTTTARLVEAEMRADHAEALDRLRGYAAPVLGTIPGRALAVDPDGTVAAVSGFVAPERLVLPRDLSPESTWLPALGRVTVEPLPGGWLVRLDAEDHERPTALTLDLRGPAELSVSGAAGSWTHRPSPRHAEILLALLRAPSGRTATELADDLFADPTRTVTVRAEMSRLRRALGPVVEARPYRIAGGVRTSLVLPDSGPVLPGSSAPVAARIAATRVSGVDSAAR